MTKNRTAIKVRKVQKPTYFIDSTRLRRYDQENLIFNRIFTDPTFTSYKRTEEEQALKNIKEGKTGHTRIDYALAEASWTLHDVWRQGYHWERLKRPDGSSLTGDKWYRGRHKIVDVKQITSQLKRASKFFGASLAGITEINEKWIYANSRKNLEPLELQEGVRYTVVLAIEMDPVAIATSPECVAAAATGLGYSKMTLLASSLAEFIRNLGYTAIPAGNDTGISIPLVIDAGLGQLGRNGLLITPEHGPRVRLCKVFTDLPLVTDNPIDFGVTDFCKSCRLCAEACEADAISFKREPTWEPECRSNNPGALKWYVNSEKCYQFWCENGTDCSTCIAVCPYNNGPEKISSDKFWSEEQSEEDSRYV